MFDGILGYFYNLNEQFVLSVKDVVVGCVMSDEKQAAPHLQLLADILTEYKDHNLNLLIITETELCEKAFRQILGNSELGTTTKISLLVFMYFKIFIIIVKKYEI